MLQDEDARPPPPRNAPHCFEPPPTLDGWGMAELRAYVAALRAEIGRAEAAITAREGHRSAADALFRTPPRDGSVGG